MDEDIPEEVFGEIPGISYFAEIILEPIGAPERAFQILLFCWCKYSWDDYLLFQRVWGQDWLILYISCQFYF